MAGEGTATGAKRDVGHGTVWVNDDIRYIAMQVSRLEALQGGQSHGFRCFLADSILFSISSPNSFENSS